MAQIGGAGGAGAGALGASQGTSAIALIAWLLAAAARRLEAEQDRWFLWLPVLFGAGIALYFAGPGESDLYTVLALVCLVMGAVTSYARARAEGVGFQAKVGIAERADRLVAILVMTGFSAIFDLPVLLEIALWALAVASTITVIQRIWVVRQQAYAEAGPAQS